MNIKIRGAMAALAAMVVLAPNVFAQTEGKGSIGGIVGVPFFLSDEDTKNGQSPRLLGQAQFQYAFSDQNRLAVAFGYGWVGYKAGTVAPYRMFHAGLNDSVQVMDDVLTKFQPISATFLHSFGEQGKGWVPYAGGGVNITRIEIVNDRQKIKDPATFDSYVNWAPGLQAQGGFEYFLSSNNNVSFDAHARYAYLFSENTEEFPSGFTGPHSMLTINLGVNVYFWPIGHKPIETVPQPTPEPLSPEAPVAPSAPDTTAAPDTSSAPTPPPVPPPPPPAPPDTAKVDTTRAPGGSQQAPPPHAASILRRDVKPAPTSAPAAAVSAKTLVLPKNDEDEEAAICPAPTVDPAASGMFGVPGVPIAPPRPPADDQPPPEGSGPPEGHATP